MSDLSIPCGVIFLQFHLCLIRCRICSACAIHHKLANDLSYLISSRFYSKFMIIFYNKVPCKYLQVFNCFSNLHIMFYFLYGIFVDCLQASEQKLGVYFERWLKRDINVHVRMVFETKYVGKEWQPFFEIFRYFSCYLVLMGIFGQFCQYLPLFCSLGCFLVFWQHVDSFTHIRFSHNNDQVICNFHFQASTQQSNKQDSFFSNLTKKINFLGELNKCNFPLDWKIPT